MLSTNIGFFALSNWNNITEPKRFFLLKKWLKNSSISIRAKEYSLSIDVKWSSTFFLTRVPFLIVQIISFPHPTISIALPPEKTEEEVLIPLADIDKKQPQPHRNKPKISRSFEQPIKSKPKPERMALSLDVSSISSISRKCSLPERDRASPITLRLDEIAAAEPLLENQ